MFLLAVCPCINGLFVTEAHCQDRRDEIPQVYEQRRLSIENTISRLEKFGSRSTCEEQWLAAEWIYRQCIQIGLETRIEKYEFEGKVWPNVIGIKRGSGRKEEHVALLAHLDSIAKGHQEMAPGADDNGGGIAALLEVGRRLRSDQLQRTVLFCFFSNEERNAAGSKAYVAEAKRKGIKFHAVLNVDDIGYAAGLETFTWTAIERGNGLRERASIIKKMLTNSFLKIVKGDMAVEVVGREPNRGLVGTVAAALRRGNSAIHIKQVVSNDCG